MIAEKSKGPHFLIVGAQKSGTTSLADALGTHSGIFICEPREPEFFSRAEEEGTSWESYQDLFSNAAGNDLCGEASTGTMLSEDTLALVREKLPDVKLLAVLRDPAKRAFSGYVHSVKKGYLPVEGSQAVFEGESQKFLAREEMEYDWFSRSQYAKQLKPFLKAYGTRMKVVVFEDLLSEPSKILEEVQEFLEVEVEDLLLTQENKTMIPKSAAAEKLVKLGRKVVGPVRRRLGEKGYRGFRESILNYLGKKPPRLEDELAKTLWDKRFAEEVLELEALLGRRIESWGPSFKKG